MIQAGHRPMHVRGVGRMRWKSKSPLAEARSTRRKGEIKTVEAFVAETHHLQERGRRHCPARAHCTTRRRPEGRTRPAYDFSFLAFSAPLRETFLTFRPRPIADIPPRQRHRRSTGAGGGGVRRWGGSASPRRGGGGRWRWGPGIRRRWACGLRGRGAGCRADGR